MRHTFPLALLGIGLLTAAACTERVPTPSRPFPTANGGAGGNGNGGEGGDGNGGGGGQGGGSGGGGGSGNGGGGGSGGGCDAVDAVIVQIGQPDRLLLRGVVVTPDEAFDGEVLIVGDTLACVAPSCAADPEAAAASIVDTHGVILPGLIDSHNHILFDIFNEDDWTPTRPYTNHNQWTNDERYGALVDAKQYLTGEDAASPLDLGCEMNKYGELKGLIAGTTSIVGSPGATNKSCYGSLARTIDQAHNDLDDDKIQTSISVPSVSTAVPVCTNFADGDTDAYVVHVGEGIDASALAEFTKLGEGGDMPPDAGPGCLYSPKTTVVHGTALGADEFDVMASSQMSLSWSPRSNVFLYGAGTDLGATTDIPLARSKGINVALSPDWSIGGSQNLLDELRFADQVDNTMWGDSLTPKDLTEMVTINAAAALGLGAILGSLTPGKKADVLVITGDTLAPYDALLAATPGRVRLVIVGGVPLYGDDELAALAPASPGCEVIPACCADKFVCVAEEGGTADNKLGQTLAEIEGALTTALQSYDAMDVTQWDFAPPAPLVKCP